MDFSDSVDDIDNVDDANSPSVESQRIDRLDELERQIRDATRNSYLVVGHALKAIRDDQLWRIRYGVATFEEYCNQR
jgi:hypothetical protein